MEKENLEYLRHSCAHLLAAAVMELWPDTKRAIGPSIENGFYYDFEFSHPISESDFPKIEQKMHELVKNWPGFEKKEVDKEEALQLADGNQYKEELIKEFASEGQTLTYYKSGDFLELCRGEHIENPSQELKHFKLLSVAGAYWRGDEKNKMLTRIYGTCFPTKEELDHYLWQLEEAKKRDHRKLGKELELFKFEDIAPGSPFWYPKGMIIFKELEKLWRKIHDQNGYQEISTPIMVKSKVFETSGHWDHYRHNMFNMIIDDESYSLKPMNCPESTYVFSSKTRSYKDLPLRYSEVGRLHRREKSGQLGGLLRVLQLTMDDAHIYTSVDRMGEELQNILDLVENFYKIFNFVPQYYLSTRPDDFMGERRLWDKAESDLERTLKKRGLNYKIKEKDGAFYGPKIDIHIDDAIGRTWQLATIQLDFQMPKRFKLTYIDKDGTEREPVMIHRAIFGSFERFMGILIEHYAGAFPLWLAPVQVAVLPISEKHHEFAKQVRQYLESAGIRTDLNSSNESIGKKIRESTLQKVPFMVIIGEKEIAASDPARQEFSISVRTREGDEKGQQDINEFISTLQASIEKYQ